MVKADGGSHSAFKG